MRHHMAVFSVLFFLFLPHISLAETNVSLETNTSEEALKIQTISPTFSTTYWQLIKLFDEDIYAENMHRETYMLFSPVLDAHGEFKGATGCNDILGKYNANESQLSFDVDHIAMTRMACPDENIETDFLKALKQTKSWSIKEDKLMFLDANQSAVITFKSQNEKQRTKKAKKKQAKNGIGTL
ncbi:MAG: META domain-containing protein [Sulfurovum sp.]|nr:META domain-containing protein [Sulfurovum sp.]